MPIENNTVNAVSMTVLPDAPTDPVTGLKVPTIAVATAGGVSVIKHNGTVVSSSAVGTLNYITLTPALVSAGLSSTSLWYYALNPGSLGASFPLQSRTNAQAPDFNTGNTNGLIGLTRSELLRRSGALVQKLKNFESDPARSVAATITNTHNTGHLIGDTRRAYLSDVDMGSVAGPELVTNGGFDTDLSGWSGNSDVSWDASGRLKCQVASGPTGLVYVLRQDLTLKPNTTYVLSMDVERISVTFTNVIVVVNQSVNNSGTALASASMGVGSPGVAVAVRTVFTTASDTSVHLQWIANGVQTGLGFYIDNISVREVIPDRSYKAQGANITGTLTRSQVAQAAQLVAYSGFSSENYLREPYSADLDFAQGEWTCSAWVNVPAVLPVESFPVVGPELVVNGDFSDGTTRWTLSTGVSVSDGKLAFNTTSNDSASQPAVASAGVVGRVYQIEFDLISYTRGSPQILFGDATFNYFSTSLGRKKLILTLKAGGIFQIRAGNFGAGGECVIDNISVREVGPSLIADRAHSSGAKLHLGVTVAGSLTATAFDGTTTRTVTTTAAYSTATWLKAEAEYTTDGTLSILVNGVEVAATRGNPLLSLNNPNAVLTIGNSYAADAPFPGSIALLKLSATAPTAEQAQWMYEQEKQMFREGAQVTLPDAGSIADLAYDDLTDKWVAVSAANESEWSGLVRTSVTPTPAGSYSKVSAASGVQLLARTTTNPGVDITVPAQNLREELIKRGEAAARLNAQPATFDYVGGFTATTTSGSTSITSAAGLTYPVSYVGARVTGSGIPADTFVAAVVGTTVYLTKAATASASAVQISFTDFILPVGYEAKVVLAGGANKVEGATKDFVRLFDGFKETIRFGTAPGHTAAIQIQATRSAA